MTRAVWRWRAAFGLGIGLCAMQSSAEVIRWDEHARSELAVGIERIDGVARLGVDPVDPRNAIIADLARATRNQAGRVEFEVDVSIMRRVGSGGSARPLFVEVPNRGGRPLIDAFGAGRAAKGPEQAGDRFLLDQGFDIAWIGWQFDVARGDGRLGATVPRVDGGMVRGEAVPDARVERLRFGDLAGYEPRDGEASLRVLTVRDGMYCVEEPIDAARWTLASSNEVALAGGFEPGRIYALAYRAKSSPVAGLGLAAVRDVTSWLRHAADAPIRPAHAVGFGVSQSGRYLRTFLRDGFNADEQGRMVFDGVWAHVAGAAYLSLNEPGATPTSLSRFSATQPPFVLSGAAKLMLTNTSCEYWCEGRSAALVHATDDGSRDLELDAHTRVYLLAGAQHGPAGAIVDRGAALLPANPTPTRWTLRALAVAIRAWIERDVAPPESRVPRIADGTLVAREKLAFPAIPGVPQPDGAPPVRIADGGAAQRELAYLVPAVDADGIERAGVRPAELVVPVATAMGWNFRKPEQGAAGSFASLVGSRVPFPRDDAHRTASKDPRASLAARYADKADYLERARRAVDQLVRDGFIRAEDVDLVMRGMEEQWGGAG